jgi:hypothetical protein
MKRKDIETIQNFKLVKSAWARKMRSLAERGSTNAGRILRRNCQPLEAPR